MGREQIKLFRPQQKLAGKETSPFPWMRPKRQANKEEVSTEGYVRDHVKHFVLCLRDAYGFRDPMEVIDSVTLRLEQLFPDLPIEKVFKWFYGNALGWSTGLEKDVVGLPAVDSLGLDSKDVYEACKIFGGRTMCFLQKFFRRQIRHIQSPEWKRRRSAFSKAQTFLMFKKGSPQVSKKLIDEAASKHREAMSNKEKGYSLRTRLKKAKAVTFDHSNFVEIEPFPLNVQWNYEEVGGWGDYEEDFIAPALQQKEIEKQATIIINKLFKPGSFKKVMKREETLFPSTSAHVESYAARYYGGAVNIVKDIFEKFRTGDLDRMTYHPRVGVKTHYFINYDISGLASSLLENEFYAQPVYLQEPLKVRTITKGPSVPYWFFRPIQQFLWNSLLRHPVFTLIGNPISGEILDRMLPFALGEGSWLSGDYSAATDNLVRWLSKHIWSEICIRSGIPDPVYYLGKKGLIGHNVVYDRLNEGIYEFEVIKQQNGQLMGSPLSFPILCIANATICMLAFDRKKRNFNKSPILINGDDCVMFYTEEEKKRWRSLAEFIGMTPSPGKCYYAKDWLQMNSELFVLRKGSFRQIPFTNFSLASPYLAKGGEERTIESISQTMINFCYNKDPKWIDVYLRRMGPWLKAKCPGLVSWFLPQCLGGLGLMTKSMSGDLFTTDQLKVATLFYNKGVLGKRQPYVISSFIGGKANYQVLKQLERFQLRTPVFDKELKTVKSYWSERFFKEREEERIQVPLLWENLVTQGQVSLEKKRENDILSRQIFHVFNKKARKIDPLSLNELLRYRGMDLHVPKEAFESNYEPRNVFVDTLVNLTRRDREFLLSL